MSETEVTTEVQFENSDNLDDFATGFFGQKQPEEKPAATTEGTEQDDDAQASDDTEAQKTDDDAQDEAELEEEVSEKPKKKTVQDRIDEVVRQREEIRRESAAEIAKLRQDLEDFKKSTQQPVQATAEAQEPTPDAVDANGDPIYELGEFDPQYIRDLTRFTLEQEKVKVQAETEQARKQAEVQQEHQALQTQWNDKLTKSKEDYPDILEKGRDLLNGFNDLDQNYAGYLSTVIMSMDKGPDVLYYLANHPDEATAIVNSGAQKATLALGRIEARFLQSEQEAPKPKVTKAPAPPSVQARGTNGAYVSVAPDTDDLNAFEKTFFVRKK